MVGTLAAGRGVGVCQYLTCLVPGKCEKNVSSKKLCKIVTDFL